MSPYILRCVHSKNRNCFLGVNPKTFNNNVRNALDFKVSTVRLNLGNEQYLYFSTFPDYTLTDGQFSLNGFFALKVNLSKDQFYEIEEQNEAAECRNVTFCPVSVDDWEILQSNTEMTEEVFLNQIRILSLHMIFPIWISGLCLLLRVVEIEPNDPIQFAVISSATRVIVIPEYRPQASTPAPTTSTLPADLNFHPTKSTKSLVRTIGNFVYTSLPDLPSLAEKKPPTKAVKPNFALVPGRHRRLFRVELDENTASNPTIARINRSDWSDGDDDGTDWPSIFAAKVTVYRSHKEPNAIPEHIPQIYFLLIHLTSSNPCRKNHLKLSASFAALNCIRPTDKLVVSNTTRRPRAQTRIELYSQQWSGPTLLLQHYFHAYLRQNLHDDQPILLTDGCFLQLNDTVYSVQMSSEDEPASVDSPIYIALSEETLGQHTIVYEEKKDWKWSEMDSFRKQPVVEHLSEPQDPTEALERLWQILHLQLQIEGKRDFLVKNVIVTGRSGCGKKTMVNECCLRLWTKDLVFYKLVDCLSFKGRKLDLIVSAISQLLDEMIFRQPSILVLDHFDELFPNETTLTDANIILATQKLSLSIRELFQRVQHTHQRLLIVPIAKQLTNIHRLFTEETPLFSAQILPIEPLNSSQRRSTIQRLIANKSQTISEELLQSIVNRTESFVIKDLYTLIDNALLHSWMSFEDRQLESGDFEYAFEEFKPISVKLLDDTKKNNRTGFQWTDIGGMEEIKQELIQTVQWRFEYSNYFSHAPIRLVSGLLLYGPSGCGKTLVAQTLANECKVNFLQVKGPELLNKYVGSSEQNIRDLFTRARSVAPCIVLFDEFEALVPRRGRDSAGVTDRVVNQLLTELDGVETLGDIVVIAATSRPDLIDPALLRPGRLDKHLYIGFPTRSDLLAILRIWTKKLQLAADVQLDDEDFLAHCETYTGADIKALIYNVQLAAFEQCPNKQAMLITQAHFQSALQQTPYSIPEHMRNANEHFYRNWRKPISLAHQTTSLA